MDARNSLNLTSRIDLLFKTSFYSLVSARSKAPIQSHLNLFALGNHPADPRSLYFAMCRRQYRVYCCRHQELIRGILYCDLARTSLHTGRRTMCGVSRDVVLVADPNLCPGRPECYILDLVREGWRCHVCAHRNPPNTSRYCQGQDKFMGHAVTCEHRACNAFCTYS